MAEIAKADLTDIQLVKEQCCSESLSRNTYLTPPQTSVLPPLPAVRQRKLRENSEDQCPHPVLILTVE